MPRSTFAVARPGGLPFYAFFCVFVLGACSDQPAAPVGDGLAGSRALATFECNGTTAGTVSCKPAGPSGGGSRTMLGGQNMYLRLSSSNVSYDSIAGLFQLDVTVQNLMNEMIGTPDGIVPDPDGVQVFFMQEPAASGGLGTVTILNADGLGFFTGAAQPYYAYPVMLHKDDVSPGKTWQMSVPKTVTSFSFVVAVETDTQPMLVVNELFVNPNNTITEPAGEWVELYNAGTRPVNLKGLVIADSAASGRRPYHLISSDVIVAPGGYVTLGGSTNTTTNGGVPVDYSYGGALSMVNSLDAFKISRVVGEDTLTLDRVQYASAAISAQNGIGRELKNPALDNSNVDGSNWADAAVTAVYGPGGRGTPKAQNSTYTP